MNKTEKAIYELLKKNVLLRDEKGIYTIFPQKLLIQASGKSDRTVRRALRGLEEIKYISCIMHQEINIVKIYFLKENDLTELEIIDRSENDRPPLENDRPPLENDRPPLENEPSPELTEDFPAATFEQSKFSGEETVLKNDTPEEPKELPIVKRTTLPEKYFLTTFKPINILFSGNFPRGRCHFRERSGHFRERGGNFRERGGNFRERGGNFQNGQLFQALSDLLLSKSKTS